MKKNIFVVLFFCFSSLLHGSAASTKPASSNAAATASSQIKFKNEQAQAPTFKIDRYTQRRGAPRMVELKCKYCNGWVISYQKDGPGRLLRCYLDRIHGPKEVAELQLGNHTAETLPWLKCHKANCGRFLGAPLLYKFRDPKTKKVTEERLSFRLLDGRTYLQKE
jgi:hypothetical protein